MLAPTSSALAVTKTFFIEIFEKWIFQIVIRCRGVCAKRLVGLGSALGTSAATTVRDSGEVRFSDVPRERGSAAR
jgi:hypothetical protein